MRLFSKLLLILALSLTALTVYAQEATLEPGTLRNPLTAYASSDPWLTYYDGNYYLAATTWTSDLLMRRSPTLSGLKTAIPTRIYSETDPSRCCNMWAPEFRLIDGPNGPRWYFYYTAGTSGTLDNQRVHVLESEGTDPMGPYTYKGKLFDPTNDTWAIDGSLLELNGELYFLFSSWIGPDQSNFIAPMSDPWTISGPRSVLSRPEYDWESSGDDVNEGPVALQHDGNTFVIYSASFCGTADYKLGMLTYNGGDPLDTDSWIKSPEPVFERSDENGVFGPAHNGFFESPDGTESWIVYHANDSAEYGCDDNRTTRVQEFTWNEDGTPNFGVPVSTDTVIAAPSGDMGIDPIPDFSLLAVTRFQAYGFDSAYLRRIDNAARVDVMSEPIADAGFYLRSGLADPEAISLESVSRPGYFLVQRNNSVVFGVSDGSDAFAADASWWVRPGLADESWISLESFARPGAYLGKQFGITALFTPNANTPAIMLEDATFLTSP